MGSGCCGDGGAVWSVDEVAGPCFYFGCVRVCNVCVCALRARVSRCVRVREGERESQREPERERERERECEDLRAQGGGEEEEYLHCNGDLLILIKRPTYVVKETYLY